LACRLFLLVFSLVEANGPHQVPFFTGYRTSRSAGIDFLDLFQQAEIVTHLFGNFDKGAEILGKAAPAKTQRRIQKTAAIRSSIPCRWPTSCTFAPVASQQRKWH